MAALDELLALFDEDERIYTHYGLQTEAHIRQDGYQLPDAASRTERSFVMPL